MFHNVKKNMMKLRKFKNINWKFMLGFLELFAYHYFKAYIGTATYLHQ
jgi:hypothetical protein